MEKSKIQKKPEVKESAEDPLLLAALANKNVLKLSALCALIKALCNEYSDNVDFYDDLIRFNLGSTPIKEKVYKDVCFHDLPPEIEKVVAKMYRILKNCTTTQIYSKLNLFCSTTNRTCPIETKWVYHYIKTYSTKEYLAKNTIDDTTLLTPLSNKQYIEYMEMRF